MRRVVWWEWVVNVMTRCSAKICTMWEDWRERHMQTKEFRFIDFAVRKRLGKQTTSISRVERDK